MTGTTGVFDIGATMRLPRALSERLGTPAAAALILSILCAVLAAAPAWLPAVGIWTSTDMPSLLLALSLVSLGVASALARRAVKLSRRALGLLAAVAGVLLASAAMSGFASIAAFGAPETRAGLLTFVPLLLMLVLGTGMSSEIAALLRVFAPWVLGAWLLGMVVQKASGSPLVWGLSSNSAITAQVFLLLVPLVTMGMGSLRTVRLLASAAAVGVMLLIGSAVGAGLMGVWLVVELWLSREGAGPVPRLAFVIVPSVHLLASVLAVFLFAFALAPQPVLVSRPWIWRAAADLTAANPVLGSGPDSFSRAVTEVVDADSAYMEGQNPEFSKSAHSLWLEASSQYGLLGVAAFLAALTAFASGWSRNPSDSTFPFAMGLILFAGSLVLQPLELQTLPLVVLMMASSRRWPSALSAGTAAVWRGAALIAGAALLAFSTSCLVVGSPETRPGSLATAQSAASLWRWESELWMQVAYRHGTGLSEGEPGATIEGISEAMERAVSASPGDYGHWLEYGQAGEALGASQVTVGRRYDESLARYPYSPSVNFQRGMFLAKTGDAEGARDSYELLARHYPDWEGTAALRAECERLGIDLE